MSEESKLEQWAYNGETRFYKSMTSTDDKSSFAFINKGHADCKIQGALHLLEVVKKYEDDHFVNYGDAVRDLVQHLKDYCGVKDE